MNDNLFSQMPVDVWLARHAAEVRSHVENLPPERVLRVAVEDLAEETAGARPLRPLVLRFDDRYSTGVREGQVDISRDQMRAVLDRSRPAYVRSTVVDLHIPFDGDAGLLRCQPNTFDSSGPPRGSVQGSDVVLTLEHPTDSLDDRAFAARLDAEASRVLRYAEYLRSSVEAYVAALPGAIRQQISTRRALLERNSGLERSLGVPVRRRDDPLSQLAVPVPPRRPVPVAPPPRDGGYTAEPAISEADFAGIVEVMVSARRLIERAPATFRAMPEESLRDVVLVILNNQFGAGAAETFSGAGKTDILIQSGDGAVFITECKIWSGPAAFNDAIDQLLRYLVWRDTKAALMVFVRNADITAVTAKAEAGLRAHADFKRQAAAVSGEPAFVLHHAGDREREILVALLIVPVPEPGTAEAQEVGPQETTQDEQVSFSAIGAHPTRAGRRSARAASSTAGLHRRRRHAHPPPPASVLSQRFVLS